MNGRSAMDDLWWFLGLVVILFVVWIYTGGPDRTAERRPDLNEGTTISFGGISRSGSGGTAEEQLRDVASDIEDIEERIEELKVEGIASPYKDLVYFSGGNPRDRLARDEYVRIRTSSRVDTAINITGWRIESLITGVSTTIPGASPLPFVGTVNSASPLLLGKNQTVILSSGRSPLGISFRNNICIGYLDQYQRFEPRLSQRCPDPEDEFTEFSGIVPTSVRDEEYETCRNYIDRNVRRCELVTENLRSRDTEGNFIIEPPLSNECIAFIQDELTYQGCVARHRVDSDFYLNEWRVYLGSYGELWREKQEVIRLLDQSGRVVDVWQY